MSDNVKNNSSSSTSKLNPNPMRKGKPIQGAFEKPKDFKGSFKRLMKYLRPQRTALFSVIILTVIATVLSVLIPKILGKATTELYNGVNLLTVNGGNIADYINFSYVFNILAVCILLYVLSGVFNFLTNFISAKMSQTIVYNMRAEIHKKLDNTPLKYHDKNSHGEILSRVTNDIETINGTFQESLVQILKGTISIIGIIVMMLTISFWLTLIIIISIPILALVTMFIAKKSQKLFIEQQKELGEINGYIEEFYTGQSIVKLFNHEKECSKEFSEINCRLKTAGQKAQIYSGIIMPMLKFVNNLVYVAICVTGAFLFGRGIITVGNISAFIIYGKQFAQPINETAQLSNVIQSTLAAAERVFEVLDETEEDKDLPDCISDTDSLQATVSFESVDFSYEAGKELIKDMNFTAKEGDTIAIVGPTGAGKTTLVNLLLRFYNVDSGFIKIDGIDIKNIKRDNMRKMYGMVLQDTWLFSGTIRENLTFGKPDATDEELREVAKQVHIDHFIETLPDGYNTLLKEDSNNISQGQKQLLTIARAILTKPRILILDEATSSVDTRTEKYIQEAMSNMIKNRTSFVIAHRLSTIKNASLILVMNKGKLIEQGTHKELLAAKGFYADLYNSQFTQQAL